MSCAHAHNNVPLRILGWCVALQLLGFALEYYGYRYFHSMALYSDSWHMAADALPALITFAVRAIMQSRRQSGFGINASGIINGLALIVAGIFGVREATRVVDAINRPLLVKAALMLAVTGLVINAASHLLARRHSHHCAERYDIWALDRHFLVDTLMSGFIVAVLLANSIFKTNWIDVSGGFWLGWLMIGFGVYVIYEAPSVRQYVRQFLDWVTES